MRYLLLFLTLTVVVLGCADKKKYHDVGKQGGSDTQPRAVVEILRFQEETNVKFKNPETSPLPDRYRKDFEGLDFFEPDTNYRVVAKLERTPDAVPFMMPTTTDRKSAEVVYGLAHFSLNGQLFRLEIYRSPELDSDREDYLFLPFLDATNGDSTYGGGRYIDLSVPQGDSLIIDFNKAYNPYCVYNPKYSCPIVPRVNTLHTQIKAGMKAFQKAE